MTVYDDAPRIIRGTRGRADTIFRSIITTGGMTVLAVMVMVGVFLGYRASEALSISGFSFLTEQAWEPDSGKFGIAAVIVGTILIALVAIAVAVPLALGTALFISEYASRRVRKMLISIVDLMAAIPSVVFGLWGFFFLQQQIVPVSRWISHYFGWIPFLHVEGVDPTDPLATTTVYTSSTFIAGIVVGLMITPIVSSIMREVFSQTPVHEKEAALGLGSTRWSMIYHVVIPYGKGGIIGGTMLGLGRALGETIAVYMIISPVFVIQPLILQNGASSVAALIALRYGEATQVGLSALMAAGLALFALTLIVNFGASLVVARSRSGAAS